MKTPPEPAGSLQPPPLVDLRDTLAAGLLAAALSAAVLAWRGRADTGSAAAPFNAVSHMWWGDEALRRDDATVRHTLFGGVVHAASAVFWAGLYDWICRQRPRPTAVSAAADAAALMLVAAVVDLKLIPRRLKPGFERRLSGPSLAAVFGAVGAGLALGGVLAARRRGGEG